MRSLAAALALLAVSVSAPPARAALFVQPPGPGACGSGCATSSHDTVAAGWRAYDDFSLATATQISGVGWRGFYRDIINHSKNPVTPSTLGWEIKLWSDVGGAPGVVLQTTTLTAAAVSMTALGTDIHDFDTVPIFDFHADLPVVFDAAESVTYWISIVSAEPLGKSLFLWTGSTIGGPSIQELDASDPGSRVMQPNGLAFSLDGSIPSVAIPGPAAVVLLGLGLAAVAVSARRRRA